MPKYETKVFQNAFDYFEGTAQERHLYICLSGIIEIKRALDIVDKDSPMVAVFEDMLELLRKEKSENPYNFTPQEERNSSWLI